MSLIKDIKPIEFPVIHDHRGNLSFIETGRHIPFEIKRVYYLYDVPGGAERGGHAHKDLQQLIIAMNGSFDVVLDDGYEKKRIHLNRSYNGLYIPKMLWRELDNFSSGSVCMVLASEFYTEDDYIRDHNEYVELNKFQNKKAPQNG
jgi:dTDP-4-dehydrorhamnose 3,5-epimerase-like enzyme